MAVKSAKIGVLVDKLGKLKAEMAELKKLEDGLKEELIAAGVVSADGELFHAVVSRYDSERVDWKALREEYHPPKFLEAIAKHASSSPVVAVKVFARKAH